MTASTGRHNGAQATVFRYFAERPNKLVFLADLEKATALPPKTIQNAISQLRFKGEVVEVNIRGSAWTYRPDAKPEPTATTAHPTLPADAKPADGTARFLVDITPLKGGRFVIEGVNVDRTFMGREI